MSYVRCIKNDLNLIDIRPFYVDPEIKTVKKSLGVKRTNQSLMFFL